MHAIPEKLNALRQQMEATMIRRLHDQREEFDKKLVDACGVSEENAVQRCMAQLKPMVLEMDKRLQVRVAQVQLAADQAPPLIQEVMEQVSALRNQVNPLQSRADAAAARLDRLGVAIAATSKDCNTLCLELKQVTEDLHATNAEHEAKRGALERALRESIRESSDVLASAVRNAVERADEQNRLHTTTAESLEHRLRRALAELEEQSRREAIRGDDGVINKLMPAVQTLEALLCQKVEECNASSERLTKITSEKLREEMELTVKRCASHEEELLEKKSRDLSFLFDQGLAKVARLTEEVRDAAGTAVRDQVTSVRATMTDGFQDAERGIEGLRQQLANAEQRCLTAALDAKNSAIESSTCNFADVAKALRGEADENHRGALQADETLRQDLQKQLRSETSRLTEALQQTASGCNTKMDAAVGLAAAQLREALTAALREANERTDSARCAAADALSTEAQMRQQCFANSDAARDALANNLREEMSNMSSDFSGRHQNFDAAHTQRHESAGEAIRGLKHAVQTAGKETTETLAALRGQLKAERQMTEEGETSLGKNLSHKFDVLEARLQSEASDIRKSLGDSQKRFHEEAIDIRVEMREKAGKREMDDSAKACQERCLEVANSMNSNRARLEASAGDFAARCREVKADVNETRLRCQKETMQLGSELSQLRAACTSLTNGTMKALQIVGIIGREEAAPDAAPEKEGAGVRPRNIEVEDLLAWDRGGTSMAVRVERQWRKQESLGYPTLLALVEKKAEFLPEDLAQLRIFLAGGFSPSPISMSSPMPFQTTWGASTCASAQDAPLVPTAPTAPKPPASPNVKDLRAQQAQRATSA